MIFPYPLLRRHITEDVILLLIVSARAFSYHWRLWMTMKARAGKPKKADKREKARIVKRMLALSESEQMAQGISRRPSVSQAPRRGAPAGRGATTL